MLISVCILAPQLPYSLFYCFIWSLLCLWCSAMLNVMIYSYQLPCLWLNQCRIPPVLSALMDLPKQSHLSSRTDIPPHSTWQACLSAFNLMTRSIYRMWQSLQTVQGVGGGGGGVGGWTSPALLQCHISWQLPFSVPCFSLVASRLPSPHQLCFSRRLFLLRFPERRLKTAAELPQCRQILATWAWGPAGLCPTRSDRWWRQKTEMKNILNFVHLEMRLRWRTCSAQSWMDVGCDCWHEGKNKCDETTEMYETNNALLWREI